MKRRGGQHLEPISFCSQGAGWPPVAPQASGSPTRKPLKSNDQLTSCPPGRSWRRHYRLRLTTGPWRLGLPQAPPPSPQIREGLKGTVSSLTTGLAPNGHQAPHLGWGAKVTSLTRATFVAVNTEQTPRSWGAVNPEMQVEEGQTHQRCVLSLNDDMYFL